MKVYVIPTEKACNASCWFCITNTRKSVGKEFLSVETLEKVLAKISDVSSIEITGGGEPLLNKDVAEVISVCSKKAPTKLYTNAALLGKRNKNIEMLKELCISRAHYNDAVNEKIMGISYDISDILKKVKVSVKFSLLLIRGSIDSSSELLKYLDWSSNLGIRKVVVRELYHSHDRQYMRLKDEKFVSIDNIIESAGAYLKKIGTAFDNKFYSYNGLNVEFETCGCNLNSSNRIIRPDGKIYNNWDSLDSFVKMEELE